MKRILILMVFLLFVSVKTYAWNPNLIPQGDTLPSECKTGESFIFVDIGTYTLYLCGPNDTWTTVGGTTATTFAGYNISDTVGNLESALGGAFLPQGDQPELITGYWSLLLFRGIQATDALDSIAQRDLFWTDGSYDPAGDGGSTAYLALKTGSDYKQVLDEDGNFHLRLSSKDPIVDSDGRSVATTEMYGDTWICTGTGTWAIPAIASGMYWTMIVEGASTCIIDPNSADTIYLNGAALSQDENITSAPTGGAGAWVQCQYRATNSINCYGYGFLGSSGGTVAGGALMNYTLISGNTTITDCSKMRNGIFLLNGGNYNVVLPDLATCASDGMRALFYANDSNTYTIEANANDDIDLFGNELGTGDCITNDGTEGSYIEVIGIGNVKWRTINPSYVDANSGVSAVSGANILSNWSDGGTCD